MRLATTPALAYAVGLGFLALSKAKYNLFDYTPTADRNSDEAADLRAIAIVDQWLSALRAASPGFSLAGRSVLELGPGADVRTGVMLLALGARSYVAYDIHDLASRPDPACYDGFVARLVATRDDVDPDFAARLPGILASFPGDGRLRFVTSPRFDFAEFEDGAFDLVVSNAALEHFHDPAASFAELTPKCARGAGFVAEIDLATHSRWVRRVDPLNIYRFHDGVYTLFAHAASPNRVRPEGYREALARRGWTDIVIRPGRSIEPGAAEAVRGALRRRFRDAWLRHLSVLVTANRP